ncbi:MAG: type II toxin-antitoxin system VapC family toxin [Candidatus Hadarchaeales archaeon]
MAIFLDTSVLIAARNVDDKNHTRAKELMRLMLKGEHGEIYTSDYVIDEAITLMLRRTKRLKLAIDVGEYVLSSSRITRLRVTDEVFHAAWERFKSLGKRPMSFTDCTSLALMEKVGIKGIASFDSGFDGLVQRIS